MTEQLPKKFRCPYVGCRLLSSDSSVELVRHLTGDHDWHFGRQPNAQQRKQLKDEMKKQIKAIGTQRSFNDR